MAKIFTIGHSTRTAEAFRDLLSASGVRRLVDVRRLPGSRRFPHFSKDQLGPWLGTAGIEYLHEVELGGRRKAFQARGTFLGRMRRFAPTPITWRPRSFRQRSSV